MTPASARFTRIFYFTVIPFPASCCCCFYSRCSFVIAPFGISTFTFRLAAHILERFESPPASQKCYFFFVILSRYGLKLFSRLNMRGISEFRDVLSDLPFAPLSMLHFGCSTCNIVATFRAPPRRSFSSPLLLLHVLLLSPSPPFRSLTQFALFCVFILLRLFLRWRLLLPLVFYLLIF